MVDDVGPTIIDDVKKGMTAQEICKVLNYCDTFAKKHPKLALFKKLMKAQLGK